MLVGVLALALAPAPALPLRGLGFVSIMVVGGATLIIVVPLGGTSTMPPMVLMNHSEKLEAFNGVNFKK